MRTRRVAYALAAVALANPAAALSPPWLVCDNADGTTSELMHTLTSPDGVRPGVVGFEVHEAGTAEGILQVVADCTSGKALAYDRPDDLDTESAIYDLFENTKNHNLRQLAREIEKLGVETTYGRLDTGNCACNPATYRNSF